MSFADAPAPDKVALLRTGAHVRRKLDANPQVQRIDNDRAEIWYVHDFLDRCAKVRKGSSWL